mmetsp:Transcript_12417/g.29586  ORF Transcript_12417/g.29586 Transcript_12417/m.29586 type:complete len:213 (-) Transcript_12417:77-715(-)
MMIDTSWSSRRRLNTRGWLPGAIRLSNCPEGTSSDCSTRTLHLRLAACMCARYTSTKAPSATEAAWSSSCSPPCSCGSSSCTGRSTLGCESSSGGSDCCDRPGSSGADWPRTAHTLRNSTMFTTPLLPEALIRFTPDSAKATSSSVNSPVNSNSSWVDTASRSTYPMLDTPLNVTRASSTSSSVRPLESAIIALTPAASSGSMESSSWRVGS